jgi:adenylate kinase
VKLAVLGPPSSGKGTQSSTLAEEYGIPHISTGDLLRGEVTEETALGREASPYMAEGKLVPDDLVIRMMTMRLSSEDCEPGFILDGYPRTLEQADELDKDFGLDIVLYIDVTEEEIVRRAAGRRVCARCSTIYHLESNPPEIPETCDVCASELVVREDDTEPVVRRRLEVFIERTEPLLERYGNIIVTIDGNGSPEETYMEAKKALRGLDIFSNNVGNNV